MKLQVRVVESSCRRDGNAPAAAEFIHKGGLTLHVLNEKFLARLHEAFPEFYDQVSAEALEDALRIRKETGGDLEKALVRARFESARRVWWPYLKGSVPFLHRDRDAMEAFSRLVLTVDHIVGHVPPTMHDARSQVVGVLRSSLDIERLKRLLGRDKERQAAAGTAAASAGFVASMTALVSPVTAFRHASRLARYTPVPVRVTLAAVVAAALLSVPLVAGFSAGHHAEASARDKK